MDGFDVFVRDVVDLEKKVGIVGEGRSWESYCSRRNKGISSLIELLELEADRLERVESFD